MSKRKLSNMVTFSALLIIFLLFCVYSCPNMREVDPCYIIYGRVIKFDKRKLGRPKTASPTLLTSLLHHQAMELNFSSNYIASIKCHWNVILKYVRVVSQCFHEK